MGNDAKDAVAVAAALAFLLFSDQVAPTGVVWLSGRQVVFRVPSSDTSFNPSHVLLSG